MKLKNYINELNNTPIGELSTIGFRVGKWYIGKSYNPYIVYVYKIQGENAFVYFKQKHNVNKLSSSSILLNKYLIDYIDYTLTEEDKHNILVNNLL